MSASNRLIVAILVVAALAVGFWVILLAPKREEADKLSEERDSLQVTLAQAQSEVQVAEAAKATFPDNYRQLVVLGEAVPEGEETSSLLVEISRIATRSGVDFTSLQLNSTGGEAPPPAAPAAPPAEAAAPESSSAVPASETVPPTEVAASLMPLGATIGPAGLGVMPYSLNFNGTFFQIADFIGAVDSLVQSENAKVGVEGRLITVDGFSLSGGGKQGKANKLSASFSVTTYVTPPGLGVTAGASPSEPAPVSSTPGPSEAPVEGEAGAAQ